MKKDTKLFVEAFLSNFNLSKENKKKVTEILKDLEGMTPEERRFVLRALSGILTELEGQKIYYDPIGSIKDLVQMTRYNANIEELLKTAYKRGFADGKDYTKEKAIEAIQKEK